MWKIKQIFDGEYGCEERQTGEKQKCLVVLEDKTGAKRQLSVEDEWLTAQGLDEGSIWPEDEMVKNS